MEFTDLESRALLVCSASTIACLVSSNVCGFLGIDNVDKVDLIPFIKMETCKFPEFLLHDSIAQTLNSILQLTH